MDILAWGVTLDWMNDNKNLHLVLSFFGWLFVGVVGTAMFDRYYGNEGGEIFMIWLMWVLFGWPVPMLIAGFPVLSILICVATYVGFVICSKLYELISNYGKEIDNDRL